MNNFVLVEIEEIIGRLKIYKLMVNNTCEFDEFEKQIEFEASYFFGIGNYSNPAI